MDLRYYYHKYNYWVKQFLAAMIIVFSFLLIDNPTILILKLWIVSSVPFILLQIAGLSGQLSIWRIVLTLKKNEERDLDDDLLQLAQDMGSNISTYFLGKDLSTALLVARARGRYVYDGWIPIVDWDIENVRQAINSIEQVLSTFSLQGRNWFRWEPKYYQNEGKPNTTLFKDENVREIENFNAYLDEVSNITASIGKSAAWLNQSIRTDEPAAKFLFSFLAIESLILYIESSKSDNILHTLKSGEMSPEEKIFCIEQLIETTFSESPIETIKNAYFECVRTLSEKLRKNIESIFGKESEEYNMLFKDKIEGSTLYDIRHKIAHGGLNALEDVEKNIIKKRIWDMEKMSRKYLNKVIERISGNKYFQVKTIKSMSLPFSVISHRRMYSGPVHMAYFYT